KGLGTLHAGHRDPSCHEGGLDALDRSLELCKRFLDGGAGRWRDSRKRCFASGKDLSAAEREVRSVWQRFRSGSSERRNVDGELRGQSLFKAILVCLSPPLQIQHNLAPI